MCVKTMHFSLHFLPDLRQICIFDFSSYSAATYFWCGGKYYGYFVGNIMLFPVVKFENWLRFDKVTADYKVTPFYVDIVYIIAYVDYSITC